MRPIVWHTFILKMIKMLKLQGCFYFSSLVVANVMEQELGKGREMQAAEWPRRTRTNLKTIVNLSKHLKHTFLCYFIKHNVET